MPSQVTADTRQKTKNDWIDGPFVGRRRLAMWLVTVTMRRVYDHTHYDEPSSSSYSAYLPNVCIDAMHGTAQRSNVFCFFCVMNHDSRRIIINSFNCTVRGLCCARMDVTYAAMCVCEHACASAIHGRIDQSTWVRFSFIQFFVLSIRSMAVVVVVVVCYSSTARRKKMHEKKIKYVRDVLHLHS